jgi:VWFA-related protein
MISVSYFRSRPADSTGIRLIVVATLLLVTSSTMAQVPDRGDVRTFFEPIEVPLVSVDVHVTDADGRAVPGLTMADFELLEDGLPVEITHFAVVSPQAVPEATARNDQELNLVVFLDESDIAPRQRRATIEHLRELLTMELPAKLRLMLVTFEGRATTLVPLTDDPSRLLAALDERARDTRPRLASERDRILRDLLSTAGALRSAGTSQFGGPLVDATTTAERGARSRPSPEQRKLEELVKEARRYPPAIRASAALQRQGTERLLGELELLVRSLSAASGRKAILLVCGGLEARPGEGLFLAWEQAFPEVARQMNVNAADEARRHDVGPRIKGLVDSANRYRVSFYTLSDQLRVTSGISAEGSGTRGHDLAQAMADRNPLLAISRATGGRSLRSSSGLAERLGEVVHEMASCYSLGYIPDHPADDLHHTLTVRVRREGLNARHRQGYFHSQAADRIAERTLAAAVSGVADNPLEISVEAEEVGATEAEGGYLMPVLVKVPIARLMLYPEGDRHTGQITALVLVHGPDGLSEPQSWRYPINVANDQMMEALGRQARLVLHLKMAKGRQRIAVGVRDDVAGTEATATLEIDLPLSPRREEDGEV